MVGRNKANRGGNPSRARTGWPPPGKKARGAGEEGLRHRKARGATRGPSQKPRSRVERPRRSGAPRPTKGVQPRLQAGRRGLYSQRRRWEGRTQTVQGKGRGATGRQTSARKGATGTRGKGQKRPARRSRGAPGGISRANSENGGRSGSRSGEAERRAGATAAGQQRAQSGETKGREEGRGGRKKKETESGERRGEARPGPKATAGRRRRGRAGKH